MSLRSNAGAVCREDYNRNSEGMSVFSLFSSDSNRTREAVVLTEEVHASRDCVKVRCACGRGYYGGIIEGGTSG